MIDQRTHPVDKRIVGEKDADMEIAQSVHDRCCRHLWRFTPAAQQGTVAETDGELRGEQRKNKIGFGCREDACIGPRWGQKNIGKL